MCRCLYEELASQRSPALAIVRAGVCGGIGGRGDNRSGWKLDTNTRKMKG